jgi:hypothetical protein
MEGFLPMNIANCKLKIENCKLKADPSLGTIEHRANRFHSSTIINYQFSIFNFQFSIFNFQFAISPRHYAFCILHFALCISLLDQPSSLLAAPTIVLPLSGEPFAASVASIDGGRITLDSERKQLILPFDDLVRWGWCPPWGSAVGLVLCDGGWLAAAPVSADSTTMTVESVLFGKLKIPLPMIAGVVFQSPSDPSRRDRLHDVVLQPPTDRSCRLLLLNGDELSGRFGGIAEGTIKFTTDVGPIDVKTDRIQALILDSARQRPAAAFWAGFRDGSRLSASQWSTQNDRLRLTAAGQPLSTSRDALVFLQPLGDRVIYLSDLKTSEYRQTPTLDLPWPYRADRGVTGDFLRCDGRVYLKGLGVHAAARLTYVLDRSFRQFQSEVGVDDSASGGGSVQFRVVVDGRERYSSPIIRGCKPPLPVSVDIRGARRLELLVDGVDHAEVLDRADWLDARLVR